MPYDPQTQYRGDAYIADGMKSVGENVSKGLDEFYQLKQKSDSYQAMIPSLVDQRLPDGTPLLSQDEAAKAIKGGLGAKEGAIATANARMHNYYLGAQASNLQATTGHTNAMTNYYGAATQGMQLQNKAAEDAQTKTAANSSKIAQWKALLTPGGQPQQVAPATPVQPAAPVQAPTATPSQFVEPPMPTQPGGVPNNLSLYYGQ